VSRMPCSTASTTLLGATSRAGRVSMPGWQNLQAHGQVRLAGRDPTGTAWAALNDVNGACMHNLTNSTDAKRTQCRMHSGRQVPGRQPAAPTSPQPASRRGTSNRPASAGAAPPDLNGQPIVHGGDIGHQANLLERVGSAHPPLDACRHALLNWKHSAAPPAKQGDRSGHQGAGVGAGSRQAAPEQSQRAAPRPGRHWNETVWKSTGR
jgi:hypothetical protein